MTDGQSGRPASTPVACPVAIVQHGHQYLITDGYANREGLTSVLEAFRPLLRLHHKLEVPLNLHFSGTLLEAIAWHDPDFLDEVRGLLDAGLVELLGSAYSQSILTWCSPEHVRRQLDEGLRLMRLHLGINPEDVQGMWVPERVWDTELLATSIENPDLPNGGYRYVLLDDRLNYPVGDSYSSSDRAMFDARTAPGGAPLGSDRTEAVQFEPYLIEGTSLTAVPLSGDLRYCLPPRGDDHWRLLDEVVSGVSRAGDGGIAVFGDDLERSAGVGSWSGSGEEPARDSYLQLMEWLAEAEVGRAVLLSPWLAANPPSRQRSVEPGTFFELAQGMGAGERYERWWDSPQWAPYRVHLERAERVLLHEGSQNGQPLWSLAWKQLMACWYETGWHVTVEGVSDLAPWSRAHAAHVRTVHLIAAAARRTSVIQTRADAYLIDVDADGVDEIVIANNHLYGVLSPDHGGRLVHLFDLDLGVSVIGNPADDWNWQEDLNRYMDDPPNHPAALADLPGVHDRFELKEIQRDEYGVEVVLAKKGLEKIIRLDHNATELLIDYATDEHDKELRVRSALSPDYLSLLRNGRRAAQRFNERNTRGWRVGASVVYVGASGTGVKLSDGEPPLAGHAFNVDVIVPASTKRFTVRIGVGRP